MPQTAATATEIVAALATSLAQSKRLRVKQSVVALHCLATLAEAAKAAKPAGKEASEKLEKLDAFLEENKDRLNVTAADGKSKRVAWVEVPTESLQWLCDTVRSPTAAAQSQTSNSSNSSDKQPKGSGKTK